MYLSSVNETSFQYSASSSSTLDFVLDSGATNTDLRDAGALCPLPTPTSLLGVDSSFSIPCHNTSTLPCPLFPSGTVTGLHIPSLRTNLLSQRSLQQATITTVFPGGANYCALYNTATGRLLSRIPFCPRSRLYTLRFPRPPTCQVASPSLLPPPPLPPTNPPLPPTNPPLPPRPPDSDCSCRSLSHPTILLHHRLGHPNFATLRSSVSSGLLHGLPSSLPPLPKSPAPPCTVCVQSKLKQQPHRSSPSAAAQPLDLVHMDLWGPNPSPTRQGHRYLLVLVDDHSRYSSVSLLRTKADASAAIIAWLERANTHFGRPVRRLHSHGGGEFLNNQVSSYCQSRGILQTPSLTPHSRTALLHAALLTNLYPHPLLPSTTPTELWTKDKCDVSSLRVWGSKAYVLIHPSDRSRSMGKLAPRTFPCIFLGHNPTSPDYLFLHPPSGRLVRSRDVVFDESTPYYSSPPSTDPLPPLTRPLIWSDTTPPPLLPPPPILPPPPPPSSPSHGALPSSGDTFDPEPLSSPVSPTHSSPSAPPPLFSPPSPPNRPSPPPRTVLTLYPHTRSRDGILGASPPVTLSSSTLPPLSPLLRHFFQAVLHQPPPAAAPSASSPSPAAAPATAPAAAPAAGPAAGSTAAPAARPAAAPAAAPAAIPAFHTSLSEDSHEEFLDLHSTSVTPRFYPSHSTSPAHPSSPSPLLPPFSSLPRMLRQWLAPMPLFGSLPSSRSWRPLSPTPPSLMCLALPPLRTW
ncbi:unnamed protein product [Closterium sp. NIES-53]